MNTSVAAALDPSPLRGSQPVVLLIAGVDRRTRRWSSRARIPQGRLVGARADTILVATLSKDRDVLELLNVPRNLGVDLPNIGYQRVGWAFEYGGASLLVAAVRRTLSVPIHHFIQVSFDSLVASVDAVGGIEVDVPAPIRDTRAGLDLHSGRQTVTGTQALALLRTRLPADATEGISEDDGAGRSVRRSTVIEGFLQRLRTGLDPLATLKLTSALGRHLVVDESLLQHLGPLADAARSVRISPIHLPVRPTFSQAELLSIFPPYYRSGTSYLELDEPAAATVLDALRARMNGE